MEPTIQHSRIGLVGSGEFTSAMTDIDRQILASIGPAPTVVVLPTGRCGVSSTSCGWARAASP